MDITIEGYEIGERIGRGGMAEVYRARHLRLDRDVAIKVMLRHYSDDPDFAERFMREARIAAQLNHPNIAQIYDVDSSNDHLFIAMELVTGGDLTRTLQQEPSKDAAINIFAQLCDALDYAHQKGYIHRDIKPANILFRDNGSLALSDFGIARAIHSNTHMTMTGTVIGTPSYMSPEQAQGFTLDSRSDLYSVAVIAYQFITGHLPYQADSSISLAIKHVRDPIPTLPGALAPMQDFFNTALAKEPEQRFPNGQTFINAFTQALQNVDTKSYTEFTTLLVADRAEAAKTVMQSAPPRPATPPPMMSSAVTTTASAPITGSGAVTYTQDQSPPKSPAIRYAAVGLIITALALAGWLFLGSTIGPKQLSPAEQARLSQLLSAADKALQEERLISPAGNNAYEHFLGIMALSPEDPVALNGIQQVTQQVLEQGQEHLTQGELSETAELITQMRTLSFDPIAYSELQISLSNAYQQQQQLADQIRTDIEKQLAKGNVDNALDTYQQSNINQFTPEQQIAIKQTLTAASTDLINRTQQAIDSNELSNANQTLDQASSIATLLNDRNTANKVATLQQQIDAKESRLNRNRKFQEYLNAGNNALDNGNLVSPASKNAWHYYNQALRLKPNDAQSLAGIENVKQALHNKATAAINTGNLTLAKTTVAELQSADSNYPQLSQLHRDLQIKERDQKRSQKYAKKVKELFAKAQIYLDRDRANGADKMWAEIKKLDPTNPGLKALGKKIADGYVSLAQREIDAKDWEDVNVWVEKGLKHVPDHQKLLEQRKLAEEKIKAGCNSLFKNC